MLDPGNPDANLLAAELQRDGGQAERARAWLFAWALSDPAAAAHSEAIRREGQLLGDGALVALAATLARRAHAGVTDGDATDADPSPARQALLEIARGQPELAATRAQLGIDANPGDPDALVAGLVASHLLADEAAFVALLRRTRSSGAPGADTAALMAELLRARVGDEAAERWLAAHRRVTAPP
jgi:hypothetical protein